MKKSIIVLAILLAGLIVSCETSGGAAGGGAAPTTVIELAAKDAQLTGDCKYEVGTDRDNVGWWVDPNASASWTFDVKEAGEYACVVSWGVDDTYAGSTISVTVGDQTNEFIAKSSGNWGKWRSMTIGKYNLVAGKNTVKVMAPKMAGTYAFNLHAVIFQK
ncbi:MAG: hypothetical protein JXD23_12310 [Spirochaetales bacterium]|nr:hypothetical protein [Spirochaetales bacterium]